MSRTSKLNGGVKEGARYGGYEVAQFGCQLYGDMPAVRIVQL